jgi:hypothetical protein
LKSKVLTIGIICSILSGCYREETVLPFLGYDYFPTELGKYVEYKVDSTWQDDPAGPIGSAEAHYFLRELNESYFTDEENRQAVRVERYSRQNALSQWGIKDVWFRVRTSEISEQNEENVVFIKHNFPIEEGKTWDGNSKNILQTLQELYRQNAVPEIWEYQYANVNEPYTVNGLTFDSTVTVIQMDRPAIFGLNVFAQEVYAKDIGLVHKQLNVFDIQQNSTNPNDRDTIGFFYERVITDFGQ